MVEICYHHASENGGGGCTASELKKVKEDFFASLRQLAGDLAIPGLQNREQIQELFNKVSNTLSLIQLHESVDEELADCLRAYEPDANRAQRLIDAASASDARLPQPYQGKHSVNPRSNESRFAYLGKPQF